MEASSHGDHQPGATVTSEDRARSSTDSPAAARIGRYLIRGRLGEGGMGVVYEGYDPQLDRRVAVKLLRQGRGGTEAKLRMLREAQAMARLSHANVVQVYDSGAQHEELFIAMELVEGVTLRDWLRAERRSWQAIVDRFIAAAEGLAAAHAEGLVHRDFKPANVLISDEGRVCVADFGIASGDWFEESPPPNHETRGMLRAQLTSTGAVLGTPRYMAPEQHRGEPAGPGADQYSFCVALHEALFGTSPFFYLRDGSTGKGDEGRRYRAASDPTRAPRWLAETVRRGLAQEPCQRHESMVALIRRLRRKGRARAWAPSIGAGLATLGALGVGLGFATPSVEPEACTRGEGMMDVTWRSPAAAWRTGDADPFETRAPLVGAMDHYADRWASAYRSVCELRDSGTTDEVALDQAMGCLARSRGAMAQLIGLVAADPSLKNEALEMAAARLPAPQSCIEEPSLARSTNAAPQRAAIEVESLRTALAGVRVTHDAGRVTDALRELARIQDAAVQLDWGPLRAEGHLLGGVLAMDRNDWELARTHLRQTVQHALASGADRVAAEAEARLVFVDAMLRPPKEALEAHPLASAWVERAGGGPTLEALLANNQGVVLGLAGDRASAREHFALAVQTAETDVGTSPLDQSGYTVNLALVTDDPSERDRLFARAESVVAESLGPHHFYRLTHAKLRAESTTDPREALALLQPVCETLTDRAGEDPLGCLACHRRVAELREALGEVDEARMAANNGLACVGTDQGSNGPPLEHRLLESTVHRLAGRWDDALASLDSVEQQWAAQRELPWVMFELANVALERARTDLDGYGRRPDLRAIEEALDHYRERAGVAMDQATRDRIALAEELLQRGRSMPKASIHR